MASPVIVDVDSFEDHLYVAYPQEIVHYCGINLVAKRAYQKKIQRCIAFQRRIYVLLSDGSILPFTLPALDPIVPPSTSALHIGMGIIKSKFIGICIIGEELALFKRKSVVFFSSNGAEREVQIQQEFPSEMEALTKRNSNSLVSQACVYGSPKKEYSLFQMITPTMIQISPLFSYIRPVVCAAFKDEYVFLVDSNLGIIVSSQSVQPVRGTFSFDHGSPLHFIYKFPFLYVQYSDKIGLYCYFTLEKRFTVEITGGCDRMIFLDNSSLFSVTASSKQPSMVKCPTLLDYVNDCLKKEEYSLFNHNDFVSELVRDRNVDVLLLLYDKLTSTDTYLSVIKLFASSSSQNVDMESIINTISDTARLKRVVFEILMDYSRLDHAIIIALLKHNLIDENKEYISQMIIRGCQLSEKALDALKSAEIPDKQYILIAIYKNQLSLIKESDEEKKNLVIKICDIYSESSDSDFIGEFGYFLLQNGTYLSYENKLEYLKRNHTLSFYMFQGTKLSQKVLNDLLRMSNVAAINYLLSFSLEKEKDPLFIELCLHVLGNCEPLNKKVLTEYNNNFTFVKYLSNEARKYDASIPDSAKEYVYYLRLRVLVDNCLRKWEFGMDSVQKIKDLIKRTPHLLFEDVLIEQVLTSFGIGGNHLYCLNVLQKLGDYNYAESYAIRYNQVLLLIQFYLTRPKSASLSQSLNSSANKIIHLLNNNAFDTQEIKLIMDAVPNEWSVQTLKPFLSSSCIGSKVKCKDIEISKNLQKAQNSSSKEELVEVKQRYVYLNARKRGAVMCKYCEENVFPQEAFGYLYQTNDVFHMSCYNTNHK
ncbi:hypothetical protein MP638_006317 [Amoeboaphelidium occidentale]|nr:hypothetical protein MP638_006317 [Amoeboaphelidium occidentale]